MKGFHARSPVLKNKVSIQNTTFSRFRQMIYDQNIRESPKYLKHYRGQLYKMNGEEEQLIYSF